MTFVVTENCIKCKYTDCVEVCPVDCFYEGANMLVIHPDECIDCGVCVPECPAEAIVADNEPAATDFWLGSTASMRMCGRTSYRKRRRCPAQTHRTAVPTRFASCQPVRARLKK